MKTVIVMIMALMTLSAFGDNEMMRELADVKQSSVSAPVPAQNPPYCIPAPVVHKKRKHRKPKKPAAAPAPVVVTKEVIKEVQVEKLVEKQVEAPRYLNRLRLLGGAGPYYGGTIDRFVNSAALSVQYLPMAGLSYDRSLSKRWSVGVAGFTNLSWAFSIGYDF